jgi:PAS domain S-box-containing protein
MQSTFEQRDLTAERWRAFFENASVGIIITDQNYRFVTTNSAFQRMLGYSGSEFEQLSYLDVTVDQDRDASQRAGDDLAAGVRRSVRRSVQFDKRYRHIDQS